MSTPPETYYSGAHTRPLLSLHTRPGLALHTPPLSSAAGCDPKQKGEQQTMPNPTDQKPLCMSPLSMREKLRLAEAMAPLIRFLGSPGDWGYGTRLGDLTVYLMQLRMELEEESQQP